MDFKINGSKCYKLPRTDGYFYLENGAIYRPKNDWFIRVPFRVIGKYAYCHVLFNRKYRTVRMHRLLCEAFHGPPENGVRTLARHLDDNGMNNTKDNLAWGSSYDNTHDAIRNGIFPTTIQKKGQEHFNAKLKDEDVLEIRSLLFSGAMGSVLADVYGVCRAEISNIKNRKIWSHI